MTIRGLWESLLDEKNESRANDMLQSWLKESPEVKAWLIEFKSRAGNPYPEVKLEDLWTLYALSRISDICTLRFQPRIKPAISEKNRWENKWEGVDITLEQYAQFFESLGFEVVERTTFHPFYHEIMSVEQSDHDDAPIEITETKWPCLMLGNMVFSRAGVAVRGGRNHIRKDVCEASKLYWAYWRKYKPYNDPSHGWGNNSQWCTEFRRDYHVNGFYFYNVDAEDIVTREKVDLSEGVVAYDWQWNEATNDEERVALSDEIRLTRIELLKNRCFIRTEVHSKYDQYPYQDFYQEAE